MNDLAAYRTLVFDCDGVVLDSNKVKTEAFRRAALPYGEDAANQLVEYHIRNGGISRYLKFEYFLHEILGEKGKSNFKLNELLDHYGAEVTKGLLGCRIADGLERLRKATADMRWLVVSGGDQVELRTIFDRRGLTTHFDGGIFGSPDSKDDILDRELENRNILTPALFLGDTRYDHKAATGAGLDFVFVYGWTEFADWQSYCKQASISCIESIERLVQAGSNTKG